MGRNGKPLFVTKKVERTIENFKPTVTMLKWFAAAVNPDVKSNLVSISRESGVSEQQWHEWAKDPVFNEWWNKEWLKEQKKMIWKLDKIGWDKSRSDFKYWQAMQIKFGGMKDPTQQEVGGLSANIFVVDFKKQLRGEDVEIRQITPSKLDELPVIDDSKRAVDPLERTIGPSEVSEHLEAKLNPLDLITPNEDEVTYDTTMEPNTEVEVSKKYRSDNGWSLSESQVDKFTDFNEKQKSRRAKIMPRRKGKFVKHRSTFGKNRAEINKVASEKRAKKVNIPVSDSTAPTTVDKSVHYSEDLPELKEL